MLNETISMIIKELFDLKMSSIGLITGQNPSKKPVDKDYNSMINDQLLKDIQAMGYDPFPTSYYGEQGYLVPGITRYQLIDLGNKYNQKAVIWGCKVPEDRSGLTFNWEYLIDGKIRNEKISHHPFVCPQF